MPKLSTANTAAEVVTAAAHFVHYERHAKSAPADVIPTIDDLCRHFAELAQNKIAESGTLWSQTGRTGPWVVCCMEFTATSAVDRPLSRSIYGRRGFFLEDMMAMHNRWLQLDKRTRHPIVPLIEAWFDRPPEVQHCTRDKAIGNEAVAALWSPEDGAPATLYLPKQDNLIEPVGTGQPAGQLAFPELADEFDDPVPDMPLLTLAHEAGFGKLSAGAGARLDKRLMVHSLISVPYGDRRQGGRYTIRWTLQDMIQMFWPAPPGGYSSWKPKRHAPLLNAACNAMTQAGFQIDARNLWHPVVVRQRPANWYDRAAEFVIQVEFPAGIQVNGPLIDRPALIEAGTIADYAFDGELTLAAMWDAAKNLNRSASGKAYRIYATRPKVLRNPAGHVLNRNREVILVGGKPTTNWNDKRAVPVLDRDSTQIMERSPAADKVPALDRFQRARLFYSAQQLAKASKRMRSYYANMADKRLCAMEQHGRLVIERARGGWRILEARQDN